MGSVLTPLLYVTATKDWADGLAKTDVTVNSNVLFLEVYSSHSVYIPP